ncbi:MAG: general secretion pathway protein D [Hyphomicrobiaceae bacterium]|jgi:general secretion pathway protein D
MKNLRFPLRSTALLVALTLTLAAGGSAKAQEPDVPEPGAPLTMNFDDIELATFVKFISKVTGKNFVFTSKVTGTVSIVSPTAVSPDEAYAVFQSVLASHGLTTVEDDAVTRIVPIKDARTSGGSVLTSGDRSAGFATRLIKLHHVDANAVVAAVESIVSKDGSVGAYGGSNTLIISDTSANIARVAKMVANFDVPGYEESVEVITLEWADASRLAEQIDEILSTGPPNRGRGDKDNSNLDLPIKIVPDQRTNSLIVMAPSIELRRIRTLAMTLDRSLPTDEDRIHVYYARHADAEALVAVLSGMLTGKRGKGGAAASRGETRAAQGTPGGGLNDEISISSDPATNAVIINASLQDYRTMTSLLEKLDLPRAQVFIEAIIVEATVDTSKALGFDYQAGGDLGNGVGLVRANLSNLNNAFLNPGSLAGLVLAATSDRVIELPDGTEVPANVALFQALNRTSDVNVLSAPTLLTLDNAEAQITVGQNIPFITGRAADLASVENVFTTIERRDVGIKLRVKPQVTEGDIVVLEIDEEVSALVNNNLLDGAIDLVGPTTTIRSAQTTVSVRDGHTVVIGGLMSNSLQANVSKVPILGDIPGIGRLFRNEADTDQKVNLIIFLTPHIVRNSEDLDNITLGRREHFRAHLDEVDDEPTMLPGDVSPTVPTLIPATGTPDQPAIAAYSSVPVPSVAVSAPEPDQPRGTRGDIPAWATVTVDENKPKQEFMNWPNRRSRPPGSK